ncbi:hypothetical protein ANTPLA_LOCUS7282 [Anthophora plagiata]
MHQSFSKTIFNGAARGKGDRETIGLSREVSWTVCRRSRKRPRRTAARHVCKGSFAKLKDDFAPRLDGKIVRKTPRSTMAPQRPTCCA